MKTCFLKVPHTSIAAAGFLALDVKLILLSLSIEA